MGLVTNKPNIPSHCTHPCADAEKKNQNLGVARKIRGSGYPTDEQLSRYRRRIRVELVKDRQDAFGRNFWGKMDETKRIFCASGNHNLHIRAYIRVRPLLVEETEEGPQDEDEDFLGGLSSTQIFLVSLTKNMSMATALATDTGMALARAMA